MKVRDYLDEAKQEMCAEKSEYVKNRIKELEKSVRSMRKALTALEEKYEEFLETDLNDVDELNGKY
jgi:prefoldin subunit 5